jgi:hypothetical protein
MSHRNRIPREPGVSADDRAARQARRIAGRKLGFLIHLTVFVLVNLFLLVVNLSSGTHALWVKWPALGWGLGLAIHGVLAYGAFGRLFALLVDRELERTRANG